MSWRFNTLDKSIVMLWAIWNGDEVQNIYHNLVPLNLVMGAFFCYAWTWFSNNCITNAFLAMIEDGYVKQSREGNFRWIRDEFQDPEEEGMIRGESDEEKPEETSEAFIRSIKKTQLIYTEALYENEEYQNKKLQI